MSNPNVVISPITLHLVEDDRWEHPRVGIVARALLTVSADPDGWSGVTELCVLEVESRGVWGIECPGLVAGPIHKRSALVVQDDRGRDGLLGDFGDEQIDEARAAIDALLPGHPTEEN